jgi:hypothetical protein
VYEAVALVVRSALIDIAAARAARDAAREEQLAAERSRAAREAAARAAEEQRARAAQDQQPSSADDDSDQRLRLRSWTLWAGAELAFIADETSALGLVGRLSYSLGWFRVGASFGYGLPASLEDDVARIRLRQHTMTLSAAIQSSLTDDLWLDAGLMPGVALLSRSTTVHGARATSAQDKAHWSPVIALESGLGVRLLGAFGLRIHVAIDVVPGAPRFVYDDVDAEGRRLLRTELAPAKYLQTRAGITVFYEL